MKDSILIVDDESYVVSSLKRALADEPYDIYVASSGDEALKLLNHHTIKVVISDEKMPGMSGAELLAIIKEKFPDIIRIMLTGHASLEAAMKAVNKGEIYRFFNKPWHNSELQFSIRSAIEKYDLETENRELLTIVRRQVVTLKELEKKCPGITKLERDEVGRVILPDLLEEEFEEVLAQCKREYGEETK